MKKTSLLISAALLGVSIASFPAISTSVHAATAAPQTQQTTVAKTGILKVAAGKSLAVYKSADTSTPTGSALQPGSSWKYFDQKTVNGVLWINLGGNQWVNGSDTSAYSTVATPASTNTSKAISATGTVKILAGHNFAVYASPFASKPITGKTLQGGTSWRFFSEQDAGGYIWFNLGGNQWINDSDAAGLSTTSATTTSTASKTTSKKAATKQTSKSSTTPAGATKNADGLTVTPISGSVRVNYVRGYGIAVWTSPVSGKPVAGKKLMDGTSWKVFQETTVNGNTYYNLGGAQWIDAHYVIANLNTKGKEVPFSGKITTGNKRINVYADVNGNKVTRTIGAHIKLNAYGKIDNGQLWYRIGPSEYVRAIDMK